VKTCNRVLGIVLVFGWAASAASAQAPLPLPVQDKQDQVQDKLDKVQDKQDLPQDKKDKDGPAVSPEFSPAAGQQAFYEGHGSEYCGDHNNGGSGGFDAGVGLHILRPMPGNSQAVEFDTTTKTGTASSVNDANFGFASGVSVWLGYVDECGLGARVTWFHFDDSTQATGTQVPGSTATVFPPLLGPILGAPGAGQTNIANAADRRYFDLWDFDATMKFECGHACGLVGAGIRYAQIGSYLGQDLVQTGPGVALPGFAFNNLSFFGAGPSVMAEIHAPLSDTGLGFYATGSAGLLFGQEHNTFGTAVADVTTFNSTTSYNTVTFVEVEVGVEWSGTYGNMAPFARVGLEGRDYIGVANGSNLGLYGIALSVGIKF
jgi:Legionella pneumophila major outer membrane protein precursor